MYYISYVILQICKTGSSEEAELAQSSHKSVPPHLASKNADSYRILEKTESIQTVLLRIKICERQRTKQFVSKLAVISPLCC